MTRRREHSQGWKQQGNGMDEEEEPTCVIVGLLRQHLRTSYGHRKWSSKNMERGWHAKNFGFSFGT